MKYLKLYEDFLDDAIKLKDDIYEKSRDLDALQDTEYEIKREYQKEITSIFNNYGAVDENDNLVIELNYDVLKTYPEYTIVKLMKEQRDTADIWIQCDSETTPIYDSDVVLLSATLKALYEKYPEYKEGKGMGFFDLKTKE